MNNSCLMEIIKKRRSVRKYSNRKIDRKKILECIEAARLAPSAENGQSWRFVVLENGEVKKSFSRVAFSGIYTFSRFASRASAIIVILAKPLFITKTIGNKLQGVPFQIMDCSIAGEHLILRATELGIGSCWIGWFDFKKTRKFLKIPADYDIVALIALGYPGNSRKRKSNRKKLSDIVCFNKFSFKE